MGELVLSALTPAGQFGIARLDAELHPAVRSVPVVLSAGGWAVTPGSPACPEPFGALLLAALSRACRRSPRVPRRAGTWQLDTVGGEYFTLSGPGAVWKVERLPGGTLVSHPASGTRWRLGRRVPGGPWMPWLAEGEALVDALGAELSREWEAGTGLAGSLEQAVALGWSVLGEHQAVLAADHARHERAWFQHVV